MELNSLMSKAKKLSPIIRTSEDSPNAIYEAVRKFADNQETYFSFFTANDFLNLIILIYSFKKTGDFKLAETIFKNMRFCSFVSNTGNNAYVTCDYCDGDGMVNCDECDGDGYISCSECNGKGEVECDECVNGTVSCETCDGDGQLGDEDDEEECPDCGGQGETTCNECGGNEKVECSNCDGEGTVSCRYCDDGRKECYDCDGSGEVISDDKYEIEVTKILSWNKKLNDICEIKRDTEHSVMENDELRRLEDIIVLAIDEIQAEPNIDMDYDVAYCYLYEDNLHLSKRYTNSVVPNRNYDDFSFYIDE